MGKKLAKREQWSSRLGFVLAAVGSAVGLGNLWGFAYRSSEGGGAAFVILYLLVVLIVCLPIFIAEFSLGRNTASSAFLAPIKAAGSSWSPLGWLFIVAPVAIASYYAVIMGWTADIFVQSLFVGLPSDINQASNIFSSINNGNRDFIGQIFSLILGGFIVSGGINKGIEKLNKICMPILFIILISLAIWAAFLTKAGEGYSNFLFNFDIKQLTNTTTIRNAFSQAFFSLSLGIGIMVTYASYLNKKSKLPSQAIQIASIDTAVGLIAGLITFPIIFTFGLGETIKASTLATLFITIPTGLGQYGLVGRVVAILFFGLAYIAAITSLISLLEIPVSTLVDKFGLKRKISSFATIMFTFLIGIPSVLSTNFLGNVDSIANILLIAGGFFVSFLIGWVVPKTLDIELTNSGSSILVKNYLKFMLRYVTPIIVAAGLIVSIYDLLIKWTS
ncbi:MAG: sodium-dependent transporter [Prochlorococcus sp. SP3034]|nr:sodium-dependent transporter [Prochlorococcus sp. SP3034]